MRYSFKILVILFSLLFIIGCGSRGDGKGTGNVVDPIETPGEGNTTHDESIKIGAIIWGDYTEDQIEFIANEPRIKLVVGLGNVDPSDAILLKQLNANKPSLWFRTALNVGERSEERTFLGFWTKELNNSPEDWFFHYNSSTTDLVGLLADELGINPQNILQPNNRVIDSLWSTYLANPGVAAWRDFWREQVKMQVVQDSIFDGVRMDVFYEKLDGWTKPAANLTKEQADQLQEILASSPEMKSQYEDEIATIYNDRLPAGYDPDKFRSDMLVFLDGTKEEMGDMPLAVNPMWPSYDGTFEFYREYADIADILEIEMFVTKSGSSKDSYQSQAVWAKQVGTMIWNNLNNKTTFAFARGFSFDTERRIYALASYLIGQGDKSLFYYEALDYELSGERIGYWAQFSYLPEWEIYLGSVLDDPRPHDRQNEAPTFLLQQYYDNDLGVFVRRYENGIVLVNPSNQTQKRRYNFEDVVYLVQPRGGNVSEIHQMENAAVLQDERVDDIISANPSLKDNFNRAGALEYTGISSIQLGPREAAIILYEVEVVPQN